MESLIEIVVALISGVAGVFLFRILNPRTSTKENQQIVVKVDQITQKNDELLKESEKKLKEAQQQAEALEKEKNKEVSVKELEDFFKNKKDIQ